jgi:hypothetical protein
VDLQPAAGRQGDAVALATTSPDLSGSESQQPAFMDLNVLEATYCATRLTFHIPTPITPSALFTRSPFIAGDCAF